MKQRLEFTVAKEMLHNIARAPLLFPKGRSVQPAYEQGIAL